MKIVEYHISRNETGAAHLSDIVYIYIHPSLQIIGEGGPTNRVRVVLYPLVPVSEDFAIVTPADDELCSFIAVLRSDLIAEGS